MILYTIKSEGYFLTFTGAVGSDVEGDFVSYRKASIKEVIEDISKSAVLLIDNEDNVFEYKYYQVINPTTGLIFTSLTAFRLYVISKLDTDDFDSNLFIDNWDAITNTPALADGALYDSDGDAIVDTVAPNSFYFIVVSADIANNTTVDGENAWTVGDVVRSTGTKWIRQPRVEQVVASNVSYVNTVGEADPNWNTIEDIQSAVDELYRRIKVYDGTLGSVEDVDFDTIPPVDSDVLTYDAATDTWVPRKISGRTYVKAISRVSGNDSAPTVDGNYVITTGVVAGWLPTGTAVNDVVNLNTGVWSLLVDVSEVLAGGFEVEYTMAPMEGANYVWSGDEWEEIDAYEPNTALAGVIVSNTELGDISNPPYGAPAFTADTLRGRSVSKILDDIIFATIPHIYVGPSVSIVSGGVEIGNLERGTTLAGTITGSYIKNEGGDLDNTDPSQGGLDELKLSLAVNGYSTFTKVSNTHVSGSRGVQIDTASEAQRIIPGTASNSLVGTVTLVANTADGDPIQDNKGNNTPQNSGYGADTLAKTLTLTSNYYSRYPIWIGHTNNRFTIAANLVESTDITINPNAGSNLAGDTITNTWLQGAGASFKQLFTSNYINSTIISPVSGNAHILIICPPGITVLNIQELVIGSWVSLTEGVNYSSFTLSGITALDGSNARDYTCYYIRDLANLTLATRNLRFTTTGSIIP